MDKVSLVGGRGSRAHYVCEYEERERGRRRERERGREKEGERERYTEIPLNRTPFLIMFIVVLC